MLYYDNLLKHGNVPDLSIGYNLQLSNLSKAVTVSTWQMV